MSGQLPKIWQVLILEIKDMRMSSSLSSTSSAFAASRFDRRRTGLVVAEVDRCDFRQQGEGPKQVRRVLMP